MIKRKKPDAAITKSETAILKDLYHKN